MTGRNAAYTVFLPDGRTPRIGPLGMVVFTRTLRAARAAAHAGDVIQGWSDAGDPRSRWTVGVDGFHLYREGSS